MIPITERESENEAANDEGRDERVCAEIEKVERIIEP